MKLLIATPLYPPELGGPATYVKLLEEGLPALGVEVRIVRFSAVRHLPKLIRHIAYFRRVYREGRSADLILALDPVSTGLPAACAALLLRKPLALRLGGDYAWEQGKQRFGITSSLDDFVLTGRVPFPVAVLRSVETWVAHRAKLIIVPSDYLKRIIECWHIRRDKIIVIPNAVTPHEGGTVPEAVAALPRPRVVTVARLVPWKGIDGLIDAVASVRASGTPLSLVVVGDGPERERLEEYAREQLRSDYIFTGPLPSEDVHAVLGATDIFTLNSSYEGLSHVLIEALVSGLPIVATTAGGNAEVVTPECGRLVAINDTQALARNLKELANNSESRATLSRAAQERARMFSVPVLLERTKAALMNL